MSHVFPWNGLSLEVFSGSEIQTDSEMDRKWIGNGELSGKNNGSEWKWGQYIMWLTRNLSLEYLTKIVGTLLFCATKHYTKENI